MPVVALGWEGSMIPRKSELSGGVKAENLEKHSHTDTKFLNLLLGELICRFYKILT